MKVAVMQDRVAIPRGLIREWTEKEVACSSWSCESASAIWLRASTIVTAAVSSKVVRFI